MPPMNHRGRTIALWTAALAIVVLVAAAILAKERIRDEWYLWQLRHSEEHSQSLVAIENQDQMSSGTLLLPNVKLVSIQDKSPGSAVLTLDLVSIDTTVKAVDAKGRLILLSAGNDRTVEVGYEFTISRDREVIAKVKVFRVYQDLCGAEILFVKDGAEIRPGDKASTRI
jgi:hypothetical protein